MLQSAIRQFVPKPIQTYLQEALCEPMAAVNDPEHGDIPATEVSLERLGSGPWGVFGKMSVWDDGELLYDCLTLENRWFENKKKLSCIPDGRYDLRLRASSIVKRTSGGEFKKGWEVCDVPNRTFIMIHPGNWEKDTEGCILVGKSYGVIAGRPGVSNSRDTFKELMDTLLTNDEWSIRIKTKELKV